MILDSQEYTKALGIEWNVTMDHFRLTVAKLSPLGNITKRTLISDIAKIFDVLGWFFPSIIKMKILLQQLWELKVDWDDSAPVMFGYDGDPNWNLPPIIIFLVTTSQRELN